MLLVVILFLGCTSPFLHARSRDKARKAFASALEYHQSMMQVPVEEREIKQYRRSIYLYRRVLDLDPTYGACDDALFAIASLYEEQFRRFGGDDDRRSARHYYSFLAREYPTTRFREQALLKAQALNADATDLEHGATAEVPRATVTEIRYWSTPDATRVVIQVDREVPFHKEILRNPDRIYFDLKGARLESSLEKAYDVDGVSLQKIRVAENRPDFVRVVLDFKRIDRHSVFALDHPFRIVLDTRAGPTERSETGSSDAVKTAEAVIRLDKGPSARQVLIEKPALRKAGESLSLTRVLGLKIGRIALDPGHGGWDTGTVSPKGLHEKDLVLDVSLRLKALLEERLSMEVIMTREVDTFVPLEQRAAIAKSGGADLFVSIHANSSKLKKASGSETFFLSFSASSEELEVASRENATSEMTVRELEDILHKIALDDYWEESANLARLVQENLHTSLRQWRPDWRSRGVKKAPFIVLINSGMPSILTEIAFLSNPLDEKFLADQEGRQRMAEALCTGIEAYYRSLFGDRDSLLTSGPGSR